MASRRGDEQVPDGEPDEDNWSHPERSGRPARLRRTAERWWPPIRAGLMLAETVAGARGNDALAGGARAIALLGEAVLRTSRNS